MQQNYRIAIIRPYGYPIDPHGYNCQEIGLAHGLSKQGVSVDVFMAGKHSTVQVEQLKVADGLGGIAVYQLPFYRIPEIDHAIYPDLNSLLCKNKYNLYHVNEENEITSYRVVKLGEKLGVPVVIYQGMYKPITGRIRSTFQKFYDLFFLPQLKKKVHMALAKTNTAAEHLRRKGFRKVEVLPVGIDVTPFEHEKIVDWRTILRIDADVHIILYVGIFEQRRNIHFLLDIARLLKNSRAVLVLVGEGPDFKEIQKRIEEEQISSVILAGRIPQSKLPSLYKESSLFLLASDYEIYGMVVLEAMYFGVPVISTKTAGPTDIIDSDKNGVLMDRLNANEWADKINNILKDDNNLMLMSRYAKEKICKELTWDVVAKKYCESLLYP